MRAIVRYILGFINAVLGTCGVIIGLLELALCAFLVFKASQIAAPPPAVFFLPLFFLGFSFLLPFGLVLYSGIALLRNAPKAALLALAACALLALWGVLLIGVMDYAAQVGLQEEAAATREEGWKFATVLWGYAIFIGLFLLLGIKRRHKDTSQPDFPREPSNS